MPSLYESMRPRSLDQIVGQDRVVKLIRTLHDKGRLGGKVFWITAQSGQGKTTLARIIADLVSQDWATTEIDAQDVSMEWLRDMDRRCWVRPIGVDYHAVIVNEAHGLSGKAVSKLQTLLEADHVQRTSTWCFTTTLAGQDKFLFDKMDSTPLLSRAIEIELNHGEELELAFAIRLREVAQAEDLDGQPLDAYIQLVKDKECNMRACYQHIESGGMLA